VRAVPAGAQVALVAMRPNGEVVAMVGGRDYAASPFNRATQARRQPGSTFKLFVYLAALRDGWDPDDTIGNRPFTAGSYQPKNFAENYSDRITLEDAFARSSNVAAVRLFNEVGDRKVVAAARDLGIASPLPRGDPSLALGTSGVTLLELTSAYAAIAANSYPVAPRPFKVEEKGWLGRMFDGRKRLPSGVHEDMERLLGRVVASGTGRAAALRQPAYGKTGTSQDNRDALFVGYSGDLVVGVWIGKDDNSPLAGVTGGGLPARIWRDFMGAALGKQALPQRKADPRGQVEPQDLPEVTELPLGEGAQLRIDGEGAVISGEFGGIPLDLRIDGDRAILEANRMREEGQRAMERVQEEQERAAEMARRATDRAREQIRAAQERYREEMERSGAGR
jgi:penicillin-binding protein 1A